MPAIISHSLPEPSFRSYACEGVGTVRETCFARQLTPAATVHGLDARSKGLEAFHEPSVVGRGSASVSAAPVGVSPSGAIGCTAMSVRRDARHRRRDARAPFHSQFMIPMRAKFGVGAFHKPSRSYACEGVGPVRETCLVRRLTRLRGATTGQAPAATVYGPDACVKRMEASHEPTPSPLPPAFAALRRGCCHLSRRSEAKTEGGEHATSASNDAPLPRRGPGVG